MTYPELTEGSVVLGRRRLLRLVLVRLILVGRRLLHRLLRLLDLVWRLLLVGRILVWNLRRSRTEVLILVGAGTLPLPRERILALPRSRIVTSSSED